MMESLREWWNGLAVRERKLLITGGVVLALALAWLLIWEPVKQGISEREQAINNQQELFRELQAMREEAQELRARAGDNTGGVVAAGDLLSLANASAREHGLGGAVQRVQPQGDDRVQVWLEQAAFDELISWLGSLQYEHGVSVYNISLERQREPGRVNSRVALQR